MKNNTDFKSDDEIDRQQWESDRKLLSDEIKRIEMINIHSIDFMNFKWLKKNQEKILRNRNLIDLIG